MNKIETIVAALVVAFILGSVSIRAKADTWIVATTTSYHFDRTNDHNEHNLGLGFEHDVDFIKHSRVVGGFYKNSDYHQSVYGGLLHTPWKFGPAKVGAMFGIVTGYDQMSVMPVVIPTIMFEGKTYGVNLGIVPSMIGLQLKVKF